jgi:CheY-like chemotaxis protein
MVIPASFRNPVESRTSVLLIDDEDDVREAVALLLERSGFAVTGCSDALTALDRLQQDSLPDVILLDLMMPTMDGWEFRLRQRSNPRWAGIPVLALSADRSAKAEVIDADGFLPKPVEHRQLIDAVTRLTAGARPRRRRRGKSLERWRPLGELASEIVRHAELPVGAALGNLQLAQRKAGELAGRLRGPEAFSMVGVRQLLQRAQRAVERVEALLQGTAIFAQLAGADLLRPVPRVLIVEPGPSGTELFALGGEDEYEVTTANIAEALSRVQSAEVFDVVLCDQDPPDTGGSEFYQRLLTIAPALAARVVFIVGSHVDEGLCRFLTAVSRPCLRRPFAPADLRALVDEQLKTPN